VIPGTHYIQTSGINATDTGSWNIGKLAPQEFGKFVEEAHYPRIAVILDGFEPVRSGNGQIIT